VSSVRWIGFDQLPQSREFALVAATVATIVMFVALVFGELLEIALNFRVDTGWLSHLFGIMAALGIASALGMPKQILGLVKPQGLWMLASLGVGLVIALLGVIAGLFVEQAVNPPVLDIEYFIYVATMPGLSEELGFRGLILGLLLTWGSMKGWKRGGGWPMLLVAALPFGLLHLFAYSLDSFIPVIIFTTFAGVLLGWVRMVTGSLWPAILSHNIANLVIGLINLYF
jgi:uncharacterized protein